MRGPRGQGSSTAAAIAALASAAYGAPLWPMYSGGPLGRRQAETDGFYTEKHVPVAKWTRSFPLGQLLSEGEPAIGAAGEVFLAEGARVRSVPRDGSDAGGWLTAPLVGSGGSCPAHPVLVDDGSTVLAMCVGPVGGSSAALPVVMAAQHICVAALDASTGQVRAQWVVAEAATTPAYAPLVVDTLSGLLLVAEADGNGGQTVYAVALSGGFLVWKWTGKVPVNSLPPPAPVPVGGYTVALSADGEKGTAAVHLLDAEGVDRAHAATGLSMHRARAVADSRRESLYVCGAGASGAATVVAYSIGQISIEKRWSQSVQASAQTAAGAAVLQPESAGTLVVLYAGELAAMFDPQSGQLIQQKTFPGFSLVGGGLADVRGNVYGSYQGRVSVLAESGVQWGYKLINCSAAEEIPGTPTALVAGPSGTVTLVSVSSGAVSVVRIGHQPYPSCDTRTTCAECVGSLGPRRCGWCQPSGKCTEAAPVGAQAMYGDCAAGLQLTPCGGGVPAVSLPRGPPLRSGVGADLQRVWRGIAIQGGAGLGEWQVHFTATAATIKNPAGTVTTGSVTTDGKSQITITPQSGGALSCVYAVLTPGPQTMRAIIACGGPGADRPSEPGAALCGRDGGTVWLLAACIVPAEQHPICLFPVPTLPQPRPPPALRWALALSKGDCGSSCRAFQDCPESCPCQPGTNFGYCCGGGECPSTPAPPVTPQPPPPTPQPPAPPTPMPPLGPAGSCLKECNSAADCSGECAACLGAVSPAPGKCGAACGHPCRSDDHCVDSGCPHCADGECSAHLQHSCGGTCTTAADCTGGGGGLCAACIGGTCGATCGGRCSSPADCRGPDGCSVCGPAGRCLAPSAGCLAACGGSACSGECSTCFPNSNGSGSSCGVDCGGLCTSDAHCLGAGGCGICSDGTCGGSAGPTTSGYACNPTSNQCSKQSKGYPTMQICENVCVGHPSGQTPGGIVGKWTGIMINKGYTNAQYVWTFTDRDVVVQRGNATWFTAAVRVWGPGLYFSVETGDLAGKNVPAAFALAQTVAGSVVISGMTLALGAPGELVPYDFSAPMQESAGLGEFVLFHI